MINSIIDKLIGVPFVEGGRTMNGADCWGIVKLFMEDYYKAPFNFEVNEHCGESTSEAIDRRANQLKALFIKIPAPYAPCIILIKHNNPIYVNHVGVYIGDRKFIHTRRKVGVSIDSIDSPAWKRKIDSYYVFQEVVYENS